jgi:hypothetical protein
VGGEEMNVISLLKDLLSPKKEEAPVLPQYRFPLSEKYKTDVCGIYKPHKGRYNNLFTASIREKVPGISEDQIEKILLAIEHTDMSKYPISSLSFWGH